MNEQGGEGAVLAIHGGAGTLLRSQISASDERRYLDAMRAILEAGQAQLLDGAGALDVAVEAVRQLEECELFNAGRGAVYTSAGTHELDASVMDGRSLRAGAVAGLRRTRNPVLAARAVLEQGAHLMFVGEAADAMAASLGLEQVSPQWFGTETRLAQLRLAQRSEAGATLDHDGRSRLGQLGTPLDENRKFGTVGAVVRDLQGHLAAATSTGGMTNKRPGRVGDSPIIGAGCYADDQSVAVSCTGTGEAFMRICAAHELAALIRHAGMDLEAAARRVVHRELPRVDGRGGLIAVSAEGVVSLCFNTEGMYRGLVRGRGRAEVAIY